MSHQLSKRQQQRNEQILRGLLKYVSHKQLEILIYEGSQGIASVQTVLLPIQVGQASTSVIFSSPSKLIQGIFLCVRCAAIHRKIGTHISRIKSLTLDKWTPEQITVNLPIFPLHAKFRRCGQQEILSPTKNIIQIINHLQQLQFREVIPLKIFN